MPKTTAVRAAIIAFAGSLLLSAAAIADGTKRAILIPSGDLGAALELLAKQSGSDLVYRPDQVQGLTTAGVSGQFSTEEAVNKLLEGTPLTVSIDSSGAILIALPAANDVPQPSAHRQQRDEVEEVIVTGTNIRGARPTAPVVTITSREMLLSGHANLGEAMRALPQNFSGGQNPGVALGATNQNANYTGSSSLNLRGLGADATLTLLNGARLPYDGIIQATDVSVIPLAAIDRMEVLLDGASAIYGSDAIGGVANIILKRDYQGVEVSARYAVATDGGFEQQQYNVVAGNTWSSGGFLVTADVSENTPVYARQRDYLAAIPNQNVTIFPDSSQHGALLSGHQRFGEHIEVTLDAFYTDRDTHDIGETAAVFDNQRDAIIWGVTPAVRFDLPKDWSIRLQGGMGRNANTNTLHVFALGTGAPLVAVSPITKFINDAETIGVTMDGPLFELPGGTARLSVGGGYRSAEFEQLAVLSGETVIAGDIRSHHAYGEVDLPLASRFTLNGALRYESYDSFGDVTTPKLGFIWGPTPSFDIKASWGKSFKAPTLTQLYQATTLSLYPSIVFPGLPAGGVFLASGGNPELEPERAEVITAGFVARPEFLPGFSLEVSWFDIDYTQRVVQPIANVLQVANPAYAQFVTLQPTLAQQNAMFEAAGLPPGTFTSNLSGAPYDPADVSAIVRTGYTNASAEHSSGIDVNARQVVSLGHGQLAFTANASWLDSERQLTSNSVEIDASGVVFHPARFKSRLGASWSRAGLTLTGNINHIGAVKNTDFTPVTKGATMTTLDLIADYQIEAGPLGGMGLNIAVINAFDREPPLMRASQPFYMPYDSTNYSALGRTVGATLRKQFR